MVRLRLVFLWLLCASTYSAMGAEAPVDVIREFDRPDIIARIHQAGFHGQETGLQRIVEGIRSQSQRRASLVPASFLLLSHPSANPSALPQALAATLGLEPYVLNFEASPEVSDDNAGQYFYFNLSQIGTREGIDQLFANLKVFLATPHGRRGLVTFDHVTSLQGQLPGYFFAELALVFYEHTRTYRRTPVCVVIAHLNPRIDITTNTPLDTTNKLFPFVPKAYSYFSDWGDVIAFD